MIDVQLTTYVHPQSGASQPIPTCRNCRAIVSRESPEIEIYPASHTYEACAYCKRKNGMLFAPPAKVVQ